MKFFPSNIIQAVENNSEKFYPILFYGNEGGLISKLISSIYNALQKKLEVNNIKYYDYKKNKDEKLEQILKDSSLFSKINFIVVKNPKDQLVAELENIGEINGILIINGENLRTTSKLKSYFENHQKFISVPCYQLDKNYIKKIINDFLKNNNITIQNEAYLYLVNNINEDFLTLENELNKLSIFKKSSVTLDELQKLIVPKNIISADNYFFNCAVGNSALILREINSSTKSINESYEILISLKKIIHILSKAVINKDNYNLDVLVNNYLPKYLFLKKKIFREILIKTNLNKITKINNMIQKTEYLFRKNSAQHREILERFLLNLAKIIK